MLEGGSDRGMKRGAGMQGGLDAGRRGDREGGREWEGGTRAVSGEEGMEGSSGDIVHRPESMFWRKNICSEFEERFWNSLKKKWKRKD